MAGQRDMKAPRPGKTDHAAGIKTQTAAAERRLLNGEFEKLKVPLAQQMARNAFTEPRDTVTAMPRITPTDRDALEAAPLIEERLQWSPSQPTRARFKTLAFAVVMVCAVGRGMAYENKGERILAEADFSEVNRFASAPRK
jgi:hypothetical protein